MAQGRGNAYAAAMLLIIVGLQSCSLWLHVSAATYTVGGSKGWAIGVDYTTWAAGQTFHAGDILFFPYSESEHDVVVVDKAGYDACSQANAVATYSTGNTNVTLTGTGAHYYLCSVVGHCSAGMKLAVTVSAAAAAPTASPPAAVPTVSPPATVPTTSPPASASAPSETPSSSPITTPSTAPSPTSTPSSAPAPSPSAETPASVPSPSSPGSSPSATPSSPGTPTSSPPPSPPNASPSVLVSAASAPLLTLLAALLAIY